jgi:CRP/FNR family transcriptional regulator, cyclic AMP receptor protein
LISNVQRVHQLIELLNDVRALPKIVVLARILYKNAWQLRGESQSNTVEIDIAQEDIAMFLGLPGLI